MHGHTQTKVQNKFLLIPFCPSAFMWFKAKNRRRASLLVGTTQTLHAPNITMSKEENPFFALTGLDYMKTTKVNVPSNKRAQKTHTHKHTIWKQNG